MLLCSCWYRHCFQIDIFKTAILNISAGFWKMLSNLRDKFKTDSSKNTTLEGIFRLNAN
jgi:hypothetical protein